MTTTTTTTTSRQPEPFTSITGHTIRHASHSSSTLPLPVPHSSAQTRLVTSASFRRCCKVAVAAIVGTLGLIATWWALDLAMWTAVKDYRDDCRGEVALGHDLSGTCEEILAQELQKPPVWRSFIGFEGSTHRKGFKKLAGAAKKDTQKRWLDWGWQDTRYSKLGDPKLRDYYYMGPKSPPSSILHDELFDHIDPESPATSDPQRELINAGGAREGVRKQGDKVVLYGGIECSWTSDCTVIRKLLPAVNYPSSSAGPAAALYGSLTTDGAPAIAGVPLSFDASKSSPIDSIAGGLFVAVLVSLGLQYLGKSLVAGAKKQSKIALGKEQMKQKGKVKVS